MNDRRFSRICTFFLAQHEEIIIGHVKYIDYKIIIMKVKHNKKGRYHYFQSILNRNKIILELENIK